MYEMSNIFVRNTGVYPETDRRTLDLGVSVFYKNS